MTENAWDLRNKVALVTGSSSGAGAEIARELGRRGAAIAVHCRASAAAAEEVATHIRANGAAAAFQADLADIANCARLVAEVEATLGPIDILVNNAGPYVDAPFRALSPHDWDTIMNVNLRAAYLLAQRVSLSMKGRGWGRIVNISATSALVRGHSVYGLAKAGLIHLTESLALELAPEVTVNTIAPGQIASPRTDLMPNYKAAVIADTPLARLVTEPEVAQFVAEMCGPLFASVTGHTIVIDGGRSLPRTPPIGPELSQIM